MATRRRKNGNGHTMQARMDAIRSDLDALQRDMRGLVTDATGAATENVQGAMNGAVESAQDMVDRVGDWGNENLDGVRDVVRHQPLAACALSMSAGALLGAILLRR